MKHLLFFLLIHFFFSFLLAGEAEKKIWNKRQKLIPIINPIELDSPDILGMGHDMLETLEEISVTDTNNYDIPVFPLKDGYDVGEILGEVGKVMPNKIIQLLKAQKARLPYVLKVGQNIANKVQANIKALIPSTDSLIDKLSLPKSNDDKTVLTEATKIDYQVERAKPAQPVKSTSLKDKLLSKATDAASEAKNIVKDKISELKKTFLGNEKSDTVYKETDPIEFRVSINK